MKGISIPEILDEANVPSTKRSQVIKALGEKAETPYAAAIVEATKRLCKRLEERVSKALKQ